MLLTAETGFDEPAPPFGGRRRMGGNVNAAVSLGEREGGALIDRDGACCSVASSSCSPLRLSLKSASSKRSPSKSSSNSASLESVLESIALRCVPSFAPDASFLTVA